MTAFDEREWELDEELRSLQVLDANAGRVRQTRQACLEVLERRRAVRAVEPHLAWVEPLVATVLSFCYLAAAVHASLALLRL